MYLDAKSIIKAANLGIKYFDLFNDQLIYHENSLPFNRPAVLFEFTPLECTNRQDGSQELKGALRIHCIMDLLSETSEAVGDGMTDTNQTIAANLYDLPSAINKLIHGKSMAVYQLESFDRTGIEPDMSFQNLLDVVQEYDYVVIDNSTNENESKTAVILDDIDITPNTVPDAPTPPVSPYKF
jgi:hypothetical protein